MTAISEKLVVFVSSVMNVELEDLSAERGAAVEAVKSLDLTRPWAFEYSPPSADDAETTYLANVDTCDIFLCIAAGEITDAVEAEWRRATAAGKRRLVLLKAGVKHSSRLVDWIGQLDVKYSRFNDAADLRALVVAGIADEVIKGYRAFNLKDADYKSLAQSIQSTPVNFFVRTIEPSELSGVTQALPGLTSLYPDFEDWIDKKRAEIVQGKSAAYVATYGNDIAGLALTSDKTTDGKVRKISTLYVLPQYQHRGVGPRLLFSLVEKAAQDGVEKLYVTVSEETREALEPLLTHYRFRVEGVAGRRYRRGSWEWVWGKRLVHGRLRPRQLGAFVERYLLDENGFVSKKIAPGILEASRRYGDFGHNAEKLLVAFTSAADASSRYQEASALASRKALRLLFVSINSLDIETPNVVCLDALDLEEMFFPLYVERAVGGLVLPIREANSQRLIPLLDQRQFLAPSTVQLRTDNVFYRSPNRFDELGRGSPLFFYETQRAAGQSRLIGEGRLLEYRVDVPEELFANFGSLGVYTLEGVRNSTSKKGVNTGKALALKFDWYREIVNPLSPQNVRSLLPDFNPITAVKLSLLDAMEIRRLAGWNVDPLSLQ